MTMESLNSQGVCRKFKEPLLEREKSGLKFFTCGKIIQKFASISEKVSRLEVELLLSHVLCCRRSDLYIQWDQKLNKKQVQEFLSFFKLRKTGMPLAYITGKKDFYGYEFMVTPSVFIPRPETETLVSAVLSCYGKQEKLNIMDFGSGSGCVGLSLLAYFPKASLIAIDLNESALKVSKANAIKRGLAGRAQFLKKDLLKENREQTGYEEMDIIVANPPYIAFDDSRVQKEVVAFEPPVALFSKEGGLYHIRSWLNLAMKLLKPGGQYFFEIGAGQDLSFLKFMRGKMKKIGEFQDMSHIIRVIQLQKCNG